MKYPGINSKAMELSHYNKFPEFNISNSLLKAYEDYQFGNMCGVLFKEIYLTKSAQTEPSEAMLLGQYFEYMSTGQMPRNGIAPQPSILKNGNLSADYERANMQSILFKNAFDYYGFELIETGTVLKFDMVVENKIEETKTIIKTKGILDILAYNKLTEKKAIIDLKYSGLMDNRFEETSWDIDTMIQKPSKRMKILKQAIFYKWLWFQLYNEEIDFYFFVHSSKSTDHRIFYINIPIEKVSSFGNEIFERYFSLKADWNDGFEAKPDFQECKECPVKECASRIKTARIYQVDL